MAFIAHHGNLSGASRGLSYLVKFLDRSAFEPIVIANVPGPFLELVKPFAPTYLYRRPELGIRFVGGALRRFINVFDRRWMLKLLQTFNPDVIYYNTAGVNRYRRWSAEWPSPKIMHVRELDSAFASLPQSERDVISNIADAYIGDSQAVTDYLHGHLGIPREKLTAVIQGTDVQWWTSRLAQPRRLHRSDFGFDPQDFIIGGAGFVHYRKGVDLFVEAAAILRDRYPDQPLKFMWIGHPHYGEYGAQLQRQIERLGLSDRMVFTGQLDDPVDAYATLDIFVFSSREDPLPNTIAEAMTLGKPVVAFAVSGIPEVLGEGRGILVETVDGMALAEGMAQLIDHPALRAALAKGGRIYAAEHLDVARTIREVESVIAHVASRKGQ